MSQISDERSRSTAAPDPHRPVSWTFPATLLAVACGLGWLLIPRSPSPTDFAISDVSPPHLFIEEVDISTTDDTGRMHRRLHADALRREVPGGKSLLDRPRLTVFVDGAALWHFAADHGEVSPDGENIYLPGPVRGRRGPAQPIEIDSADVRIMTADSYGESDKPSMIRGKAFQARGNGLKIWLDEGRAELVKDARGTLQQ